MSQINVNEPPPREPYDSGDRTAAAGINLITVLIVLVVVAVVLWFLFAGPLSGLLGGTTNINVNVPTPQPGAPSPKPGG